MSHPWYPQPRWVHRGGPMHAPVPHSLGTDCGCDSLNCEKGLGGGGHYAHGSYKHGYALPSYVQEEPRALDGFHGVGSFGDMNVDCKDIHANVQKALKEAATELGISGTLLDYVNGFISTVSTNAAAELLGAVKKGQDAFTSMLASKVSGGNSFIKSAIEATLKPVANLAFSKLNSLAMMCVQDATQPPDDAPMTTPALNYTGSITGIKTAGGYVTAPKVYPSATMYATPSQLDPQASLLQQAAAAGKLSMFARPDLLAASQAQVKGQTPQLQLPPAQKSSMLPLLAVGALAALLLLR